MRTIGQLFSASWAGLKGNWKSPMLASLICMLISGGFSIGLTTIDISDGEVDNLISSIISFLITIPMSVAIAQTFLYYVRGLRQDCIDTLFQKAFREYPRSLSLGFMVYLYTFLWSLLLVIPGIIKALSYAMTNYIAIDHPDWSVGECINESMRMMRGHKMRLFLITLIFIVLGFLSIFTLGIALLWLCPWMYSIQANFYEDLKQQQVQA